MSDVVLERVQALVKSLQEARRQYAEIWYMLKCRELRPVFETLKQQLDENPDKRERQRGYKYLALIEEFITTPSEALYSVDIAGEVRTGDVLHQSQP